VVLRRGGTEGRERYTASAVLEHTNIYRRGEGSTKENGRQEKLGIVEYDSKGEKQIRRIVKNSQVNKSDF